MKENIIHYGIFKNSAKRDTTPVGSDHVGTDVMHHVMHNICDAKQDKYHNAFMVHNMVHSIIHNRMMHE